MNSTYVTHKALVRSLDEAIDFVNEHRDEFSAPTINITVRSGVLVTFEGSGFVSVTVEGYVQ